MTSGDDRRRETRMERGSDLLLAALFVALIASPAAAHRGPPFPVLVDHRLLHLPYRLSVWTDPDIGDARFFIILEPVDAEAGRRPVPEVTFWVEPISGRLARASYPAERQELRGQLQFAAQPHFDERDMWRVGIELGGPATAAETVTLDVESTPPGLGPWDLLLYSFPFLLFGALWARALLCRARATPAPSSASKARRSCPG